MKKSLKLQGNTRGTVSAEAAVASAAMLLLFAVFISIAGYCVTAAKIRSMAGEKAMASALAMYAVDVSIPLTVYSPPNGDDLPRPVKGLIFWGVTSEDSIEVTAVYKYASLFGDIETKVSSICTLWSGDGMSSSSTECVWNLPPNERGRKIEEIFGGNLPEFFPVADSFDPMTGEVVAIVSIDTTLGVYESGREIENVIAGKAGDLVNFSSGSSDDVEINKGEIRTRKLLVVIPENQLSDRQQNSLDAAVMDTMKLGIIVEIRRFQYSGT